MTDEHDSIETNPADEAFGARLITDRPVPYAAFRGALGRQLDATDPGYGHRPPHLWPRAAAYLMAGMVLCGLGAFSALGAL